MVFYMAFMAFGGLALQGIVSLDKGAMTAITGETPTLTVQSFVHQGAAASFFFCTILHGQNMLKLHEQIPILSTAWKKAMTLPKQASDVPEAEYSTWSYRLKQMMLFCMIFPSFLSKVASACFGPKAFCSPSSPQALLYTLRSLVQVRNS